jgi:hypothetical protein
MNTVLITDIKIYLNMIISKKHKYVFVAIPKTGTRTIYSILKGQYDGHLFKEHYEYVPEKFKDFFKFTIVRNPYERAVSLWWSTCKRDNRRRYPEIIGSSELIDFFKWLNMSNVNKGVGSEILRTQAYYSKFDKILYTEILESDFKSIEIFKDTRHLPRMNSTQIVSNNNKSARKHWQEYMTPSVIKEIEKYYAEDFKILKKYKKYNDR